MNESKELTMKLTPYILPMLFMASVLSCSRPQPESEPNTATQDTQTKPMVNEVMVHLRDNLDALVPYLFSDAKFSDPKNQQTIAKNLSGLAAQASFADHKRLFRNNAAASTNLGILAYELKDAQVAFEKGKKEYARYLVQSSLSLCVSCHTSGFDKTQFLFFKDKKFFDSMDTSLAKAEYAMATRQFSIGRGFIKKVVDEYPKGKESMNLDYALHMMADDFVRTQVNPHEGARVFSDLAKDTKFPKSMRDRLTAWAAGFRQWSQHSGADLQKQPDWKVVASVKSQLGPVPEKTHLLANKDETTIARLRAADQLHQLLARNAGQAMRAESMYLLGLIYNSFTHTLFAGLDDAYFKVCIESVPHRPLAKQCYDSLRASVVLKSTGSSGVNLAPEDERVLDEFRQLAY
jgi:cytochrome c553